MVIAAPVSSLIEAIVSRWVICKAAKMRLSVVSRTSGRFHKWTTPSAGIASGQKSLLMNVHHLMLHLSPFEMHTSVLQSDLLHNMPCTNEQMFAGSKSSTCEVSSTDATYRY